MVPVWLISAVVWIIPFLGQILSILFAPFFLLYLLGMYRDLKAIKGPVALQDAAGSRVFWWAVTVIGLILPVAALAWLLYVLLTGGQEWTIPDWPGMHGTIL